MLAAVSGLWWTAWSAIRASRTLQIALVIGAAIAIFLLERWAYGRGQRKAGAAKAIADARDAAVARMKRNREVHREIRSWPLDKRAQRLRELDR